MSQLTAELLLSAYANGYFPMADDRYAEGLRWYRPEMRGIIPLDNFHIPKSLRKLIRQHPFEIRINSAFSDVIRACAQRKETWINNEIIRAYCQLAQIGFAHSVECWKDEKLVGGLYGVALGAAFFGESMFSHAPGASKVALVHLVEKLREGNYLLLDAQYSNPHLEQFGICEIPQEEYLKQLEYALTCTPLPVFISPELT